MSEQSLKEAIDAVRTRINAELDAQLARLAERHETDLVNVRLAAEREAEARRAALHSSDKSASPARRPVYPCTSRSTHRMNSRTAEGARQDVEPVA